MPTQISSPPFPVGLIARADDAAAWGLIAVARAELAAFGLGAEGQAVHLPGEGAAYAGTAPGRGVRALIVASADCELPAALAANTPLPVIRVPVGEPRENGKLPLLWPEGEAPPATAPFATVAIGEAGARNAALFVVSMLALTDERLRDRWREFRRAQTQAVLSSTLPRA